ncbi:barstar family protein [Gottfriedia acidiceleris]|uniref:barstar family protein n=1 Tax=Gottfriedia acidiceleris TaxID=371036 RepID=UPI001F42EE63|nr:barstar family protein [Gottfriedia acidiceleris]
MSVTLKGFLILLFALYHILNREEVEKSEVEIDVSNIKTNKELHLLLKKKLKFPNIYEENWEDFWETITGRIELPNKIKFVGWKVLESRLPEDTKILQDYILEHNLEFPDWECECLFN